MAAAVGKGVIAALLAEGVEALPAELQKFVSLAVAELFCAYQGIAPLLVAGDAIAGEHPSHHSLDALGVVIDL